MYDQCDFHLIPRWINEYVDLMKVSNHFIFIRQIPFLARAIYERTYENFSLFSLKYAGYSLRTLAALNK